MQISLAYYKKTYYLRDAQGNIMATYNRTYAGESPLDLTMSFSLVERPIYGSSRIANFVDSVQLVYLEAGETEFSFPDDIELLEQNNGTKHFELTNHLGNVMAVVSDKRTPVLNATATAIESFQPELLIAKDYYPFGMEMSGRYDLSNPEDPDLKYRFGFQGQEKDDEWTGQTGSHLNYKYRMYDSRIARFFAIDPLASKYPYNSTYAFSENRVIDRNELEGLETGPTHAETYHQSKVTGLSMTESAEILNFSSESNSEAITQFGSDIVTETGRGTVNALLMGGGLLQIFVGNAVTGFDNTKEFPNIGIPWQVDENWQFEKKTNWVDGTDLDKEEVLEIGMNTLTLVTFKLPISKSKNAVVRLINDYSVTSVPVTVVSVGASYANDKNSDSQHTKSESETTERKPANSLNSSFEAVNRFLKKDE